MGTLSKRARGIVSAFLFFVACVVSAQPPTKIFDVWMFGLGYGLDIRTAPPTFVNPALSPMRQLEGVAVVCDYVTGNLLLYSDGVTLFDSTHRATANGGNLNGHFSSTQSALFVPVPCDDSTFYLFTADQQGYMPNEFPRGVCWNFVDRRAGISGDIVGPKNRVLDPTASERLCAIRHANKRDWWVLTTSRGGNEYRAWLVTAQGVANTPVLSRTGPIGYPIGTTGAAFELGMLKASPNGRFIAESRYWSQDVILARFDNATGVVSNAFTVDHSFASTGTYGLSFSPDSRWLYFAADTRTSSFRWRTVRQAAIIDAAGNPLDSTSVRLSSVEVVPQLPDLNGPFGDMQIGRDGKIYLVVSDTWLGVITQPNNPAATCAYFEHAYPILGSPRSGALFVGLPNIITAWGDTTSARLLSGTYRICAGDSVILRTDGIEPLAWFRDGQVLPDTTQSIVAKIGGAYYVQEATIGCGRDGLALVAVDSAPSVAIAGAHDICPGDILTLDAGLHAHYRWSTGDTSRRLIVASAGEYSVEVRSAAGCVGRDTVRISLRSLDTIAMAMPDHICAGDSVLLSAPPGFSRFAWLLNDSLLSDTTPTIFASKGGDYSVECESDSLCGVVARGTLVVDPVRNVSLLGDSLLCEGEYSDLICSGDSVGDVVTWLDSLGNVVGGGRTYRATASGRYVVRVETPAGCVSFDTLRVDIHAAPIFHVPRFAYVCSDSDSVRVCIDSSGYGWFVSWSNGEIGQCATIIGPGVVRVRVVDEFGCTRTDSVIVLYLGQSTFSPVIANDALCADEFTEAWLPAGITNGTWREITTGETILGDTVTLHAGTWEVIARGAQCPAIDTVEIASAPPQPGALLASLSLCANESRVVTLPDGGTRTLTAADSGNVIIPRIGNFGCVIVDTIAVEVVPLTLTTFSVIGGTFPPGEARNVVVRNPSGSLCDTLEISLTFDPQCVRVEGAPISVPGWVVVIIENSLGRYHVRLIRDTAQGVLQGDILSVPFVGYFSTVTETPVLVDVVAWPLAQCVAIETLPGMIRLGGVCFFEERLIEVGAFDYSLTLRPNPARDVVEIDVTTGLDGPINLQIVDIRGFVVSEIRDNNAEAGKRVFFLSLKSIASGTYLVRAVTGHVSQSAWLVITQ